MASEGWQLIKECVVECDADCFWKGVDVWTSRPHILNKRLCVVSEIAQMKIVSEERSWETTIDTLMDLNMESEKEDKVLELLKNSGISLQDVNREISPEERKVSSYLTLRRLVPKCDVKYRTMFELIFKDVRSAMIAFVPCGKLTCDLRSVSPVLAYAFQYISTCSTVRFLVFGEDMSKERTDIVWLGTKVFPKICQWIKESSPTSLVVGRKILPSLGLISTSRYGLLYQELKGKYAKYLLEIWPERTDPTKYVYQIISIASYLLVLWEEERNTLKLEVKQSFVDLGCGNGLLTHILSSEGHRGVGIDLKRRKIWNLYGQQTKLSEQPIVPSSSELFPEYDWIIGSHSDELTPWIPVIAARSSRTMKFFLLPCCAHNFDAKFQRRNSKLSIYEDYIGFVEEVAQTCGFETKKDKLRIPSTKRICIIGGHRTYSNEEWPRIDETIGVFIASQCAMSTISKERSDVLHECQNLNNKNDQDADAWAANFQPRLAVQAVRNCTALNAHLKLALVRKVVDILFEKSDEAQLISMENGTQKFWRKGGCVELAVIAAQIPSDHLQKMKSEFGGLQTLLKNHYHIFEVFQGKVMLRNYSDKMPFPKKRKGGKRKQQPNEIPTPDSKKKMCWFYENHPDGCPLPDHKCHFIHEVQK